MKKCRTLTAEDKHWWNTFIQNEKVYRQKWDAASEQMLAQDKKQQWPLKKLKKHLPTEVRRQVDADQEEREGNLEALLRKANYCPNVSEKKLFMVKTSQLTTKDRTLPTQFFL